MAHMSCLGAFFVPAMELEVACLAGPKWQQERSMLGTATDLLKEPGQRKTLYTGDPDRGMV